MLSYMARPTASPLTANASHRRRQHHRGGGDLRVYAARPPSSNGDDRNAGKPKKRLYEVQVTTPPERSLGMHKFPNNMACGETIELRKRYFVVRRSGRGGGLHAILYVPRSFARARTRPTYDAHVYV